MLSRTSRAIVVGTVAIAMAAIAIISYRSANRNGAEGAGQSQAEVSSGERIYAARCASCHGAGLEGQPNWRERLPNGRLPAPPHDETGHTWHHPDRVLFGITKYGPGKYAPEGYESDMPAFQDVLSDADIWAVLAYIKSRWPEPQRAHQAEVTRRDQSR
jgi:S-disulfanyl-L-cysteine oxidoreductase SoxD